VLNNFGNPITIDYTGKKVQSIPPHLFSVGFAQGFRKGVEARAWFDYASDYFVNGANTVKQGYYGLLNASLNIPLSDGKYSFQINATNLLNREYYYYAGYNNDIREAYPGQPIQVFGSFRYRF
jgi:outer membrane receptor protein involved in Fe transport